MKADEHLGQLGINYNEVVQDKPTKSCDDAAKERGLETRQIVKSLIIESEGQKYHILLPGDRTLSESKFGAEYRMVPPKESKNITGFESGTVHPFSTELKHVADERIFENNKVSHTVGEKKRGAIIDADDFKDALNQSDFELDIQDIAVSTKEDYQQLKSNEIGEENAKFVVNNGYRKEFLYLSETYNDTDVLNLLKEFGREEIKVDRQIAEKILDRSENLTHTQRLVEHYAEYDELPEKQEFDLREEVEAVIDNNSDAVEDFRSGQDSAVNYLIGQLMQRTSGKADAGQARELVREEIE